MKITGMLWALLFILWSPLSKSQLSFTAPAQVCPFVVYTLTAEHGTLSSSGYTWSTNPGGAPISHSMLVNTLIIFPNTPGVYTISVIAALDNGTMMATQQVTVNPTPTIEVSSSSPTVCEGATAVLNASGASQYTWSPGNTQGAVNIVTAGTHTVYGESLGCVGYITISITEVVCDGLENSSGEGFSVHTDQTRHLLYISCRPAGAIRALLLDGSGKIILSAGWQADAQKPAQIDLHELPPGLYYLRLNDVNSTGPPKTLKVLKQ